jgi:DNA repair exonuclease SbcCD ATPase subunit
MQIKTLKLFNFVTHKDTKVDFSNKGSYCIYSSDNGAGKSLILDAIPWGLWGKTIRGGSADSILGVFSSYTMVEQVWWDGERYIKITRYRKHSKYKNSVLIHFSLDGKNWEEDSSKETRKDTDKYISNLFKMDFDLFVSAVLITKPRSELNFCESKDTKRKEVLTNLLNLNWIASSLDRAKIHKKFLESEIDKQRNLKDIQKLNISHFKENIESLIENSNEFKHDKEWQIKSLNEFHKEIKPVTLKMIKEAKENIVSKSKFIGFVSLKLDKLKEDLQEEEIKESNIISKVSLILEKMEEIDEKVKRLKNNGSSNGDICEHCGSQYNGSNVIRLIKKLEYDKKNLFENKKKLEKSYNSNSITQKQMIIDDAEKKIEERKNTLNIYEDRLIRLIEDRKQYKEFLVDKKNRRKVIEGIKSKKNPFLKKIKMFKKKLYVSKRECARISSRILFLNKQLRDAEYAIEAFGNSGIKNDIISTKIDLLEEKINYYLSKISNGNIYVQLDNKVQHGQNERIGIMIQDSKKVKPLDYNEWSGGEKTKIRFSVEWAINSILESNIDLLIVDEGFDFLSEIGIKSIIDIMKKETSKKIISVSNIPEMKDMFPNKIKVELKDNCSCVSQYGG